MSFVKRKSEIFMLEMSLILFLHMQDNNKTIKFPISSFKEIEECEDIGFYTTENMKNFLKDKKVKVDYSCEWKLI